MCVSARRFLAKEVTPDIFHEGSFVMKIIDKFNETFGLSEKDEEIPDMNTNDELQTPQPDNIETPIQPSPASNAGHNVVDFNSVMAARESLMSNNSNNKPLVKSKITTVKPKSFDDDARVIADFLRSDIPVIVNFEQTPDDHARRILDFVSGITYAIGGLVQNVSERVVICTPPSVTVTYEREDRHQGKDMTWLTRKF